MNTLFKRTILSNQFTSTLALQRKALRPIFSFGHFNLTEEQKKKEVKVKEEILNSGKWTMPHPVWTEEEVKKVDITHL